MSDTRVDSTIGVEDIFGADGLDDEFSDLEELPESDDDERPKSSASAVPSSAGAGAEKKGEAGAATYEFTLPRFKKRDYSAAQDAAYGDYQHQHHLEEGEDAAMAGQSSVPSRPEKSDANKEIMEGKSKSSAAKEFMDSVMKDVKGSSSRSKRRRKNGDLDEVTRMDDEASALKRAMQKAALEDLDSHANDQPGFAKLMLLERVVLAMNKVDMHDAFMDANVLEAIRVWLEPLADRSLPPLDIQQAMFKILDT
ncbi:hypothetical protein SYNPS1DRAFT_27913, partial [Syncephalis pseudoplumigaleata]